MCLIKILYIDDLPDVGESQKDILVKVLTQRHHLVENKHFVVDLDIKHKDQVLVEKSLNASNDAGQYANEIIKRGYDVVLCDGSFVSGKFAGDDVTGLHFSRFLKNMAKSRNINIYCAVVTGQGRGAYVYRHLTDLGEHDRHIDLAYSRGDQDQERCFAKIYSIFDEKRKAFFRQVVPNELRERLRAVSAHVETDFDFSSYDDVKIEGFNGTLADLFPDIDDQIYYADNETKKEIVQEFLADHIAVDFSKELAMYLNLYGVKAATHSVTGKYYDQNGTVLSTANNNIAASLQQQRKRFESVLNCCPDEFKTFLRTLYNGRDILGEIDTKVEYWIQTPIQAVDTELQNLRVRFFQRKLSDDGDLYEKIIELFKTVQQRNSDMLVTLRSANSEGCRLGGEFCAIFFPFVKVFGTELEILWQKIGKYAYKGGTGEVEFYTRCRFVNGDDPHTKDFKAGIIFKNSGNSFPLEAISSCDYIKSMKETKFLEYWGDLLISVPDQSGTKTVSVLNPEVEVTDPIILENIAGLKSGTQYTFVFNSCVPC